MSGDFDDVFGAGEVYARASRNKNLSAFVFFLKAKSFINQNMRSYLK